MNRQKENHHPNDIRDDFKDRLKCWFQNKGILKRLESYLKNQMIVEFQRDCGQALQPQSTTLSPKVQAIKVLVGEFLLQENLLFSLSVYCTEVPFLLNLTQYNQYITRLANSSKDSIDERRLPKPRFSKEELLHILESLNLNLKAGEFDAFHNVYKSGSKGSLLTSLLGTIPKLIKKHRTLEYLLKKARRREKLFHKLLKVEKSKLKNMYVVVQRAYGVVEKHKSNMGKLVQLENAHDKEFNELSKKENELTAWQTRLELEERNLEKTHQDRLLELEDRAKTLEARELELQSKYQMLQQEKYELKVDRERFEQTRDQQQNINVDESNKLREFEQKFYALQAEVREMLETYNVIRQHCDVGESKSTQPAPSRQQRTENENFPSMKEYVNFMEKENVFLKLNSRKQRNHIGQLTNEVLLLNRRLDYLEKKIELSKTVELETPERYHHSKCSYPSSRRKLFGEATTELSSSNTSKETNLTEDIVADANSKVEALENESEALDRNCRNLHSILSRNIALAESKVFSTLSLGESSPRLSHLSGSYSDAADSPRVSANVRKDRLSTSSWEQEASPNDERKFRTSSPRTADSTPRSNSFRELFVKCRKERMRSKAGDTSRTRVESEYSSTSSSPKEAIDSSAEVPVNRVLEKVSESQSQRQSTEEGIVHEFPD